MSNELLMELDGPVLQVTFNRPEKRNAMTWAMYDGLIAACERAEADDLIRAMTLRGAGHRDFMAGTDIGQFAEFEGGADGVAYERRISDLVDRLESLRVPTLAVVEATAWAEVSSSPPPATSASRRPQPASELRWPGPSAVACR